MTSTRKADASAAGVRRRFFATLFSYPKGGGMKDWSDLESGRVKHFKGHFTPVHCCDLKELIRVVDGHE